MAQVLEQTVRLRYLDPPLDQCQALRQWYVELLKMEQAEHQAADQAADQAAQEPADQAAQEAADQAEQRVRGAREGAVRREKRTCVQKRVPHTVNADIRECDGRLDRRPPTPNQLCRAGPFVVASAPIEVSMGQSIPQRQPGTDRHQVGPMQAPPSQGS